MRISLKSTLLFLLELSSTAIYAERSDSLQRHKLKEITITARQSNPTRGIIAPVAVFKREKIESSTQLTVESALKSNTSVDLRERGSMGMQADILLYGGTNNQTMVMLNGVNFTDVRTGHQSLGLPIDIEGISEINIIGGVPGLGAYTGAVNIIAAPEYANYVKANISGGQHGYLYCNLSGAATKNNTTAFIMGSVRKSDGYTDNTDFDNQNLYTRIISNGGKNGVFDFQAGIQKRFFGANGFYSRLYPNQAEATKTYLSSLKWDKGIGRYLSTRAIVSYRKNYDKYELFRNGVDTASWYGGPNYHNTDNIGFDFSIKYSWKLGITGAGFDYSYNHIYSNVLGRDLSSRKSVAGEENAYYTKYGSRNVSNEWIRHTLDLGKWTFNGSLNLAQSPYGGDFMWSLGTEYKIARALEINASATKSMRLPTYTDLYYTTSMYIGNTDLVPEKALTYRVGAEFYGSQIKNAGIIKHFFANSSIYYRLGHNIIDWVKESEEAKWQSLQIEKLRTTGTEFSVNYRSGGWIKSITAGYSHVSTNRKASGFISKTALDYLKDKFSATGRFRLQKRIEADITTCWNSRTGNYTNTESVMTGYDPYWKTDAAISFDISGKSGITTLLYVKADNIFDSEYCDFGGLMMPGIWVTAGASITIK